MSSVVRQRHFVQWSVSCFAVCLFAVMLGCEAGKTEKKATPPDTKSVDAAVPAEQAKPAAKDAPSSDAVKDLPPPKEPAMPRIEAQAPRPARAIIVLTLMDLGQGSRLKRRSQAKRRPGPSSAVHAPKASCPAPGRRSKLARPPFDLRNSTAALSGS